MSAQSQSHPSADVVPQLVRSATVKQMFDGISDMTLWRWIQYRGFPKPVKLSGRNYWDPDAIDLWCEVQADYLRGPTQD